MDFSKALIKLKKGKKLKRQGWNGKNLYVIAFKHYMLGKMFAILNRETKKGNAWVPSVSDILAEDWEIYKGD